MLKNPDRRTAITIKKKETLVREILFPPALIAEVERVISSERVY
jgi:hypothetical protein